MLEAYKRFWTNYVNFKDRSTRSDYWYVVLCNFIIGFIIGFILGLIGVDQKIVYTITAIYELAALIPSIALMIRRLHDINKSGWYLFMGLIPLAGPIILLVYWCTASINEGNNYGQIAK